MANRRELHGKYQHWLIYSAESLNLFSFILCVFVCVPSTGHRHQFMQHAFHLKWIQSVLSSFYRLRNVQNIVINKDFSTIISTSNFRIFKDLSEYTVEKARHHLDCQSYINRITCVLIVELMQSYLKIRANIHTQPYTLKMCTQNINQHLTKLQTTIISNSFQ